MKTPRKHRHAKLIKQWIEDDSLELVKPKMIRCGDMEFPEPMRAAPKYGEPYWITSIKHMFLTYRSTWVDNQQTCCIYPEDFATPPNPPQKPMLRRLLR